MAYRKMKNITITQEEEDYIRQNINTQSMRELAFRLKIPYGKLVCNIELMNIRTKRQVFIQSPIEEQGFFDVKKFANKYRF